MKKQYNVVVVQTLKDTFNIDGSYIRHIETVIRTDSIDYLLRRMNQFTSPFSSYYSTFVDEETCEIVEPYDYLTVKDLYRTGCTLDLDNLDKCNPLYSYK